jgi:hypothetical protein
MHRLTFDPGQCRVLLLVIYRYYCVCVNVQHFRVYYSIMDIRVQQATGFTDTLHWCTKMSGLIRVLLRAERLEGPKLWVRGILGYQGIK